MDAASERQQLGGQTRTKALWLTQKAKEELWGYFLIAPWLIGFVVFALGPMLVSLYYSFTTYDILSPPEWVGLENYTRIFRSDPILANSVLVTVQYMVLFVALAVPGSLAFAVLLNQAFRGRTLARAIFYIPSITPVVATIYVWRWMLNPQYGPINSAISQIGLTPPA
jgi:multiple sugar transport system permease protein